MHKKTIQKNKDLFSIEDFILHFLPSERIISLSYAAFVEDKFSGKRESSEEAFLLAPYQLLARRESDASLKIF